MVQWLIGSVWLVEPCLSRRGRLMIHRQPRASNLKPVGQGMPAHTQCNYFLFGPRVLRVCWSHLSIQSNMLVCWVSCIKQKLKGVRNCGDPWAVRFLGSAWSGDPITHAFGLGMFGLLPSYPRRVRAPRFRTHPVRVGSGAEAVGPQKGIPAWWTVAICAGSHGPGAGAAVKDC